MDRVKSQAAVVSQLLFSAKTADAYRNVLVLTGTIIKEVALLIWLVICSVFVFGAWFGDFSINTGKTARTWWENQQTASEDGSEAAAATGKALLDVSQNGANFLLEKAREQLGLEKVEPSSSETKSASVSTAKTASPTARTAKVAPSTPEKAKAAAPTAKPAAEKVTAEPKATPDSSVAKKV